MFPAPFDSEDYCKDFLIQNRKSLPSLSAKMLIGGTDKSWIVKEAQTIILLGGSPDKDDAWAHANMFLQTITDDREEGRIFPRLKPWAQIVLEDIDDPDPLWREWQELISYVRNNLHDTPFLVECDDYDFVIGACETVIAELPEWKVEDFRVNELEIEGFYGIDRYYED
jgi:hypothetical protein